MSASPPVKRKLKVLVDLSDRCRKSRRSLLLQLLREISPGSGDRLLLNRGLLFRIPPLRHPVEGTDAAFRNLISEEEIQRMKDSLGYLNLSLDEMIPFDGEPVALGTPTF